MSNPHVFPAPLLAGALIMANCPGAPVVASGSNFVSATPPKLAVSMTFPSASRRERAEAAFKCSTTGDAASTAKGCPAPRLKVFNPTISCSWSNKTYCVPPTGFSDPAKAGVAETLEISLFGSVIEGLPLIPMLPTQYQYSVPGNYIRIYVGRGGTKPYTFCIGFVFCFRSEKDENPPVSNYR